MNVRTFCSSGSQEPMKCGVHGAAVIIAAMCAAYNIAACLFRRERHLKVNAIVYSLAVVWELKQTLHHLRACECRVRSGSRLTEAA